MTYRTHDIDNTYSAPSAASSPVRNLRRRRHAAALRSRTNSVHFSGLGI